MDREQIKEAKFLIKKMLEWATDYDIDCVEREAEIINRAYEWVNSIALMEYLNFYIEKEEDNNDQT